MKFFVVAFVCAYLGLAQSAVLRNGLELRKFLLSFFSTHLPRLVYWGFFFLLLDFFVFFFTIYYVLSVEKFLFYNKFCS